ncbi:MAG: YqiA/YcfP family alpha/beta fold hydrolase, partial [Oxalobacteraceae bacterium]
QLLAERMRALGQADNYLCPQLPASPRAAVALALELVRGCPAAELCIIGSSLGGYYATWLAERLGCRAVLLNPAVQPPRDLEQYVGATTAFHTDAPFEFKRSYLAELAALQTGPISRPERYFLLAATGDEVLDWQEMVAHYPGARHRVINGSDHGLSDFARYADVVLAFCGVTLAREPADPAGGAH